MECWNAGMLEWWNGGMVDGWGAGMGISGSAPDWDGPEADDRVPVRLTRGPLAGGLPASLLPEVRAAWYGSPSFPLRGNYSFELVNFIDGTRTITDIRNAVSAEFGPVPVAAVARFMEDLVETGLAEWGRRP